MLGGGSSYRAADPGNDEGERRRKHGGSDQSLAVHADLHGPIMVPIEVSSPSGQCPVVLVLI
jgi:hypothetical protein